MDFELVLEEEEEEEEGLAFLAQRDMMTDDVLLLRVKKEPRHIRALCLEI